MTKKRMSPKHVLFAKNLVKCRGNQKEAYLETYPTCSESIGATNASRLLSNKPEILDLVRTMADKNGVTLDALTKKLREKLDSTRGIVIANSIEHIPDNQAQLKAVELGLKVHGALKDNDNSTTNNYLQQNNQVVIMRELGGHINKVLSILEELDTDPVSTMQKADIGENTVVEAEYTEYTEAEGDTPSEGDTERG